MYQKTFNAISSGAVGKFQGQVFLRYRHGKLEICKIPNKRPGKGTDKQEVERQRWKDANNFFMLVRAMPGWYDLYKKDLPVGWNVQNRAVKDFYNAPEIKDVDGSGYTGKRGDAIHITATDDFMVRSVTVAIYNKDNELVEEGKAIQLPGTEEWCYSARRNNTSGGRIEVIAKDNPGNMDKVVFEISGTVAVVLLPVATQTAVKRPVKPFVWKRGAAKKPVPDTPEVLRCRPHKKAPHYCEASYQLIS